MERARKSAADAPEDSRDDFARLELASIRDEASRALALATLVPRGMARIALATGTAFAVLALARYARDGTSAATLGATAAFAGGAIASSVAAAFGRRARARAEDFRSEWKRALKSAEAELSGTGAREGT
ncbi:MAG TPA: hypothetical protein VFZ53_19120 [Polyangiaceae bacterium]